MPWPSSSAIGAANVILTALVVLCSVAVKSPWRFSGLELRAGVSKIALPLFYFRVVLTLFSFFPPQKVSAVPRNFPGGSW